MPARHRNRKTLIGLLFFSFVIVGQCVADEKLIDIAHGLFNDNLRNYSCVLTKREAEEAASQLYRLEGLSLNSFAHVAGSMEILIKGLRAVVERHQKPDKIYRSLQLEKYNISQDNWSYYLNKYKSSEAIARFEKWVPNNERIIIESLAKSFKPIIEQWLLEQKILMEFSHKNPDQNLSEDQMIRAWWKQKLKKQVRLNETDKKTLLEILSRRAMISSKQIEFWKKYFKNKLGDSKERIP